MLLKFQPPEKLEVYKWIAINRTDYDFAMKIFNLLGRFSLHDSYMAHVTWSIKLKTNKEPDDVKKVIKHDEKLLSFEQRKNVNDRLKPFIRMQLE